VLVLTRKTNQSIMIGDDVEISILSVAGDKVRVGITAPREVDVFRKEVYNAREQSAAGRDGSEQSAASRDGSEPTAASGDGSEPSPASGDRSEASGPPAQP
jgi:carbon storage regulator